MAECNVKHIIICVDLTPSMNYKIDGSIKTIDAVNSGIEAFVAVFNEKDPSKDSDTRLSSLVFGDEVSVEDVENCVKNFKREYKCDKKGKGNIANALSKAKCKLMEYSHESKKYIILVTDGLLEPDENEMTLKDAIKAINNNDIRCYCVGFKGELETLLDHYTNKLITSFDSTDAYKEKFEDIAEKIIGDSTQSNDVMIGW